MDGRDLGDGRSRRARLIAEREELAQVGQA
jgi:hypothetical protein